MWSSLYGKGTEFLSTLPGLKSLDAFLSSFWRRWRFIRTWHLIQVSGLESADAAMCDITAQFKGCFEGGLYWLVFFCLLKHLNLTTFLLAIFEPFWWNLAKLSEAHTAAQLHSSRHLCPPDMPEEWVRCGCTLWTAFQCVIPDLWHTQCPLAMRSNPKGLASIFSNGFTAVCWSLDGRSGPAPGLLSLFSVCERGVWGLFTGVWLAFGLFLFFLKKKDIISSFRQCRWR